MTFQELIVLLPCHSLEDFPLYHEGEEADGLLAAWSALWHPALIAGARKAPGWQRADSPPTEAAQRLIVVPSVAFDRLPIGFAARVKEDGALLICKAKTRSEILDVALGAIDAQQSVDPDLAADFLALGYGKLQVELLTRQMRYASNLDEAAFERFAVAGAEAAMRGEADQAREQLRGAFNLLGEARKYFYPVDSYLIDLTLVAATTLGESLLRELQTASTMNLLLPASLLAELASSHGDTLSALQDALDRGNLTLVGGEIEEGELPLLPREMVLSDLTSGLAEYQRMLGRAPHVFGRRRSGLTSTLPQMLHKLGFTGALHFTLDDGRFPLGSQSKVRWEGDDGTAVDALAKLPRDAAQSATFLDFARRLGESMDSDHVASVVLAHWPGMASPWYEDMRRVARYTNALGKFITLDEYFTETYAPGQTGRFLADEYRSPYLRQAVIRRQPDPLSRGAAAHRERARQAAAGAISTLVELLGRQITSATAKHCDEQLEPLLDRLSALLPRTDAAPVAMSLAVNPLSFARRMLIERPSMLPSGPATTDYSVPRELVATADSGPSDDRVIEVPAMGFAFVDWSVPTESARKREKPLAADNVLQNEFFEVTIHPSGGGIQILRDFQHRGNRLSQQIALRSAGAAAAPGDVWRDPDEDAVYSLMQAESIEVTRASSMVGEITSRGSLVDAEGRRLAGFRQRTQVWRASRIVRIDIELDPVEELRADPWNSYYAARCAWNDPTADLFRGVQGGRHPTEAKRIEAPEYIEIDCPQGRTTLLTGGLAYHRRSAMRIIDSLLIVRGETARRFSLAIGVDVANPAAAAADLIAPQTVLAQSAAPPAGPGSSWLFHIDARSVVATHWASLGPADDNDAASRARRPAPQGFSVRLLETSGRPVRATLRAFRGVSQAGKVDFRGQALAELAVAGDQIVVDLGAHEWAEIEARW